MNIIFTPEAFNQGYGGVSRVFAELSSALNSSGHNARIVAGLHVNQYLAKRAKVLGLKVPEIGKIRSVVNTGLCRAVIALSERAVVHQTYYSRHRYSRSHPLVLTVFDMIHETCADVFKDYPDQKEQSRNKAQCCQRADHICAISKNTKNDLVRILGIPEDKISVTYLGNPLEGLTYPEEQSCPEQFPYILYVGGRAWYKNFGALLSAFNTSNFLSQNFRLICFGGGALTPREIALITELGLSGKVSSIAGADHLLLRYYRHAAAHVVTSLYEGFGLTVLEAMANNCPVICSDRSSLPEVAGEAAVYFNPDDPSDLARALEAALSNPNEISRMTTAGANRAELFSWRRCAQDTLAVYRRLRE